MSHPSLKLKAWLSRTDESQEVKDQCCLDNVVLELRILIKVAPHGYTVLWKRSLKEPTEENLAFIQKEESGLVPKAGQFEAGGIRNVTGHLKTLLKSFEQIQVSLVTPDGKKLMDYGEKGTYYVMNSDCEEDKEDLEALYEQIDSLRGPLSLIKKVVLVE